MWRKKLGFKTKILSGFLILIIFGCFLIPKPELLSGYSFSSVVYDNKGKIINISLSQDDKYRLFVPITDIPEELKQGLLLYEDKYFYYHFGINPISFARAIINMLQGGRTEGASTISMQLARLHFHINSSTIYGKLEQILRAMQLERHYSKDEILEAYFNLAPYSGNIEGIGAASLIFFQQRPEKLNRQQSFALAVIPQNPNLRRLDSQSGKSQTQTAMTRLYKIWAKETGKLPDTLPLQSEKIIKQDAPHFTRKLLNENRGSINSTLDINKQKMIEDIVQGYINKNSSRGINNATVLVVNHKTMETEAYIGSANFFNEAIDGQVDGISAYRSPGSALKPFIYAKAIEHGHIHPYSMLEDIPKNYGFYTPENYDKKFYGIMDATTALNKSRNIPAVELLKRLKDNDFYNLLKDVNVKNLKDPDYYGLTLALGGFEISMIKMAELYGMLANLGSYCPLKFVKDEKKCEPKQLMSKEAAYLTLNMLKENDRIDDFSSQFIRQKKKAPVYWKTGTSYGYKDAITIGIAGDYIIGVWIGDFANKSSIQFLGREIASPLFFEIVNKLEKGSVTTEIEQPYDLNIVQINVCKDTGDIANEFCKITKKTYFIPGVSQIRPSYITKPIPIEIASGKRACFHNPPKTKLEVFNFWPTNVITAFEKAGVSYKKIPDYEGNCDYIENITSGLAPVIEFPINNGTYYMRSHELGKTTLPLKAIGNSDTSEIYWYIDGRLIASSSPDKATEFFPKIGTATITAIDNYGRTSSVKINIELVD